MVTNNSIFPSGNGLLYDTQIGRAILAGDLEFSHPITSKHIGPVSIDIHARSVKVFDAGHRLPIATFEGQNVGDAIIGPNQRAVVEILEQMTAGTEAFHADYALRWSRSLLGLSAGTPTISNNVLSLPIRNSSLNSIFIGAKDRFARLSLSSYDSNNGATRITNYDEAADLFPKFAAKNLITLDGKLIFTVGNNVYNLKQVRDHSPIDTKRLPSLHDLFEEHYLSSTRGKIIWPAEQNIVKLAPYVNLNAHTSLVFDQKNTVGDKARSRLNGDFEISAPIIDPGHHGAVVAKVTRLPMTTTIHSGDVFATASIFYNSTGAAKPRTSVFDGAMSYKMFQHNN